MALDFLKYSKIAENGREFLRYDIWEFSFIKRPAGVYMPPDENLLLRCTEFSPQIDYNIESMVGEIRGFELYQPVSTNKASGSFTLTFIDREDMSIENMMNDWADKIMEKETKKTGRKADLSANVTLRQYNTWRKVIKELIFYNCFPTNWEIQEDGYTGTPETSPKNLQWGFQFEYYDRKRLSANLG